MSVTMTKKTQKVKNPKFKHPNVSYHDQKPKNEKHEKYIKKEIERVNFNLDWNGKECKRPNLKNRKKDNNV